MSRNPEDSRSNPNNGNSRNPCRSNRRCLLYKQPKEVREGNTIPNRNPPRHSVSTRMTKATGNACVKTRMRNTSISQKNTA